LPDYIKENVYAGHENYVIINMNNQEFDPAMGRNEMRLPRDVLRPAAGFFPSIYTVRKERVPEPKTFKANIAIAKYFESLIIKLTTSFPHIKGHV
jgi:hypothetical protein